MFLDTWASWALVWGSGLRTINGSSNCYFPARAVMNGASTLQLWDRYRNIFIRRRMVREASRTPRGGGGFCGVRGLASGLMGMLNSDEPAIDWRRLFSQALESWRGKGHRKTHVRSCRPQHNLRKSPRTLAALGIQLLFDISGTSGEALTYLLRCREQS